LNSISENLKYKTFFLKFANFAIVKCRKTNGDYDYSVYVYDKHYQYLEQNLNLNSKIQDVKFRD